MVYILYSSYELYPKFNIRYSLIFTENRPAATYFTSIPPVGDPNPNRKPDASRLREIRKRLDSGHCSAKEVEAIAAEVLDECVELSSGR